MRDTLQTEGPDKCVCVWVGGLWGMYCSCGISNQLINRIPCHEISPCNRLGTSPANGSEAPRKGFLRVSSFCQPTTTTRTTGQPEEIVVSWRVIQFPHTIQAFLECLCSLLIPSAAAAVNRDTEIEKESHKMVMFSFHIFPSSIDREDMTVIEKTCDKNFNTIWESERSNGSVGGGQSHLCELRLVLESVTNLWATKNGRKNERRRLIWWF